MATYQLTGPDGSSYKVEAPDNAQEQDLINYVKQNYKTAQGSNNTHGEIGQIGQNALSDLKDLATPAPAKITDQATNLAADYLQKGAGGAIADIAKGVARPFVHPIDYAKEHPLMQAINLGSLFSGAVGEAGPESATKNFADSLSDSSSDTLASVNKKLANIPENATKMEGYKQPVPTPEELNTATQNVIEAYKQVLNDHGKVLNDAKEEAGLPATKDDIDTSVRRYGNQFGLDVNNPLKVPDNAPVEGLFKAGDSIPIKSPKEGLPDQVLTYRGPSVNDSPEFLKQNGMTDAEIASLKQPLYDISSDVPGHPAKSTLGEQTLKDLGYDMPSPQGRKPMGYTIGDHDTPEELNTEINRFKSNLQYIDPKDQVKAASYFQDQIHNQGVFKSDTAKGPVMGRLKGQYGDLADLISQNSSSLQAAKSKWANLKNSLDLVDSKIDPDRPGLTQANLKRMFVSNSPATQDQLKQLAHLEQLTGKPVITNLFQKFAGQSFKDLVSRPGREITEAAGGIGLALAGHPLLGAGALGVLAAQSPKILGALESGVPTVAKAITPAIGLQAPRVGLNKPFNTPALQSLRDKLRNQQNVAK